MRLQQIFAITVLLAFYIAYYAKMFIQKQQGIATNQIAKGEKKPELFKTEIFMKVATILVPLTALASVIMGTQWITAQPVIWLGLVLGVVGVVVFVAAMATMKNSWRAGINENEKTDLITNGIYRLSRNPAFLGFDLVYIGVFLAFANPVHLAAILFAMVMLHLQILQEEKFLPIAFGEQYTAYKQKTGRYFLFFNTKEK